MPHGDGGERVGVAVEFCGQYFEEGEILWRVGESDCWKFPPHTYHLGSPTKGCWRCASYINVATVCNSCLRKAGFIW